MKIFQFFMKCKLISLFLLMIVTVVVSCQEKAKYFDRQDGSVEVPYKLDTAVYNFPWLTYYDTKNTIINRVGCPEGFSRIPTADKSFGHWLQRLPLKSGHPKVKLYDGTDKWNQEAQAYVVDLDVGKKDLQQCADALIRLRSEYLLATGKTDSIHFKYTNGATVTYNKWSKGYMPVPKSGGKVSWVTSSKAGTGYDKFKKFLIQVYNYAGTHSLEKELSSVPFKDMKPGDILIRGGFPGHGIMVVDMAINKSTGEKMFMLAQSFMPAQEVHILRNPMNDALSPWYSMKDIKFDIETPEWWFDTGNLKRWN